MKFSDVSQGPGTPQHQRREVDTKHRKAQKLEPREETVQSSNSKFKIPEPSGNFKIQNSKPRTIDSEMVTWEQGACTTVADNKNAPVHPCHRGKSH